MLTAEFWSRNFFRCFWRLALAYQAFARREAKLFTNGSIRLVSRISWASRRWRELVAGNDGAFYGTTSSGGLIESGSGVVYRVLQDGSGYQVLHVFPGTTNAADPQADLLVAGNVLYGTATGSSQGVGNRIGPIAGWCLR